MNLFQTISLIIIGAGCMIAIIPLIRKYGKINHFREVLCVLAGALFGAGLTIRFSTVPAVLTAEAFIALLTAVALTDWDTMEIEDGFHLALLAVGILSCWTMPELDLSERIIGVFCVSIPMLIICFFVSGAFGGADLKLMAACGFFFGWKLTLFSTFLGILSGGAWGAHLLVCKKADKTDHFAFGPFLVLGMLIALFWGDLLLNAYLNLFGF
jgi:leader peptidase (prepilin peptidase)/N-methyltransferase